MKPTTDSDLTPMGEDLARFLAMPFDLLLMTKREHIQRIAEHFACLRGLDVSGHPMKFSELKLALQRELLTLASRAALSTNPEVVSDCIDEACLQTERWATDDPLPNKHEPTIAEAVREGLCRFFTITRERGAL